MNHISRFSLGYTRREAVQTRHHTFCTLLIFLGLLGAHSANWRPSCSVSCWQTLHLQGRFCLYKMSAMLNLCYQVGSHSMTVPTMTAFSLYIIICRSTFPPSCHSQGFGLATNWSDLWNWHFTNEGVKTKNRHVLLNKGGWERREVHWAFKLIPLSLVEFLAFELENICASAFTHCP